MFSKGSSGLIRARGFGRQIAVAASCLVLASLFLGGTAKGATLSGLSFIEYSADPGEVNNLRLTRSGNNLVFTDAPGVVIAPTAPCTAAGNVGSCPIGANLFQVNIELGNMNDAGSADASVSGFNTVRIVGGAGNDTLSGADNVQTTLEGDDFSPGGNDTITGGANDDQIAGGEGNDTMAGGAGNDFFNPGEGNDVASGGSGFDRFESDSETVDGADVYNGGTESDHLDLSDRIAAVTVTLNGVADDGEGCPGPGCEGDNVGTDVEGVEGGNGNDVLIGNARENDLDGNDGTDTISAGGAYDEIFGGRGNDTLNGEGGNDELVGSLGSDSLFGGRGDDYTFADYFDEATDVLSGGRGIDSIGGGASQLLPIRVDLDNKADDGINSPLVAGPRDNVKPDVENLEGGLVSDILIGDKGPNQIDGGGGNDRLLGGRGPDALLGGRGSDRLFAGKGRDTVFGDAGADRVASRDRTPDEVSCGSALDRVTGDRVDRIGPDCDKVRRR